MFQRVLIANRGEIALRVIRACMEMGIETVAVYSEADRGAYYLDLATESYCIGPAVSSESYLFINHIIAAAEVGNCDAIHPGYGFLAENADFAEQCRESKIEFIGPPHEAMIKLGDKVEARKIAEEAEVPVVPGSPGLVQNEEEAIRIAAEIGYPVLIKATAGGGGKGIRPAMNEMNLRSELKAASAEAEKAFKNAGVYIEKLIEQPRHVEVQVIADQHGNVCHLWERDCTMQRKHQKLIEEAPAPNLPQKVREDICAAAVRLVNTANYYNAGTCEFLVDKHNNFYFIEVNARIQVEHPVTEQITGTDLIREQIRVAAGEELSFKQEDIPINGVSMEVRINAEDPDNGFRGCPGTIETLRIPGGLGVRFDSHVYQGYKISPHYDSMIGKLIVHKPTREEAIRCLKRALAEMVVDGPGIKTSIPLIKKILNHNTFINADGDTKFVERTWSS